MLGAEGMQRHGWSTSVCGRNVLAAREAVVTERGTGA